MLVYNWIPIFHLVKIFAVLIRPTHLCCWLIVILSMLITYRICFICISTHTIIDIADLFYVEYVRFGRPITPNLQADVHFRDDLEHLHLIDMHFVLHKHGYS